MHVALAARDVGAMYRHLCGHGFSQYKIARMTGQSQSEVSEIMHGGRQVIAYDVLGRMAKGLGAPRGHMGLAYSPGREDDAYAGRQTPQSGTVEEVDDGPHAGREQINSRSPLLADVTRDASYRNIHACA